MNSSLFQGFKSNGKCKLPRSRFNLGSPSSYNTEITVTLSAPSYICND